MSDPLSLQGERVRERVLRRGAGAFGEGYAKVSTRGEGKGIPGWGRARRKRYALLTTDHRAPPFSFPFTA